MAAADAAEPGAAEGAFQRERMRRIRLDFPSTKPPPSLPCAAGFPT
jgi:hypothetical protein